MTCAFNMLTRNEMLLIFTIFNSAAAFPCNKTKKDITSNYDDIDWTTWNVIVVNIIIPFTMIISLLCCCCGSSKTKESSEDYSAIFDELDREKVIKRK